MCVCVFFFKAEGKLRVGLKFVRQAEAKLQASWVTSRAPLDRCGFIDGVTGTAAQSASPRLTENKAFSVRAIRSGAVQNLVS